MNLEPPTNLIVPPGWSTEIVYGRYVLVKSDDGLMVTLDFVKREYRGGLVVSG